MGKFTEYFLLIYECSFFLCPPQIYMYAAWNGWTIPMFLFLALLRLSLNYLIARSFFSPWFVPTSIYVASHWHLHTWWVYTDIYLCVPMMHCSQGLEDSVEHRTWSLRARGEDLKLCRWGVQVQGLLLMLWGLRCFQEPPKEDLTVSEKFQLVLDVAQKAQVRPSGQGKALLNVWPHRWADLHHSCSQFTPLSESVWEAGKHPGENKEVSSSAHAKRSSHAAWDTCWIPPVCVCSLFMWVQPELTQKLYVGLLVAFISSCLLPYKLLGFIIGTSHTLIKEWSHTRIIHPLNLIQQAEWMISFTDIKCDYFTAQHGFFVRNLHCRESLISILFLLQACLLV